jgi:hypothetical protein
MCTPSKGVFHTVVKDLLIPRHHPGVGKQPDPARFEEKVAEQYNTISKNEGL